MLVVYRLLLLAVLLLRRRSTPPDSPQMTFLSPTCSLILAICMSMKLDIFHEPSYLHSWNRKFLRMSWPCGVCVTSG